MTYQQLLERGLDLGYTLAQVNKAWKLYKEADDKQYWDARGPRKMLEMFEGAGEV